MSSPKRHVLTSLLFILKCFSKSFVIMRSLFNNNDNFFFLALGFNKALYLEKLWLVNVNVATTEKMDIENTIGFAW